MHCLRPLSCAAATFVLILLLSPGQFIRGAEPVPQPGQTPPVSMVRVQGMVTSAVDRTPLAEVRVVAVVGTKKQLAQRRDQLAQRSDECLRFEAITATDGRYELRLPVEGPDRLVTFNACKPGFNSLAGVTINHMRKDSPQPGATWSPPVLPLTGADIQVPVLLLVGPAPYLAGVIVDDLGETIPQARIAVQFNTVFANYTFGTSREVVADARGRFEFFDLPNRPGTVPMQPVPLLGTFSGANLTARYWDYEPSAPLDLTPLSDAALRDVRIVLKSGKGRASPSAPARSETPWLDGTVIDERAQPIAGARLTLVDRAHPAAPGREVARTDATGAFAIPEGALAGVTDEPVRLKVRAWNLQPTTLTIRRTTVPAERRGQTIRLVSGFAFRGRVVDAAGEPVAGVRVHLNFQPDLRAPDLEVYGQPEDVTDEHGAFTFPLLPAGRMRAHLIDFQQGPVQAVSPFRLTKDVTEQRFVFQRSPRPTPERTLRLNGMTWADMTPELARYYGFPDDRPKLVAIGTPSDSRWGNSRSEGSSLESIAVGSSWGKDREKRVDTLDAVLEKIETVLRQQPGKQLVINLEYNGNYEAGVGNSGSVGSMITADEAQKLLGSKRPKAAVGPTNF